MFLSACASRPVDGSKFEAGHFQSKALVRDLKQNKSQVVNLDLKAIDLENLRLDVTTSLGIHVFTLVNRGDSVEYLVVGDKKHYMGQSKDNVLAPILSVPINPRLLGRIFFEKPFQDKSWSCTEATSGTGGKPKSCKYLRTKMTVTWESNKEGNRLISILYPGVSSVQINVRSFDKKLKDKEIDGIKTLKVPSSFTTVKI